MIARFVAALAAVISLASLPVQAASSAPPAMTAQDLDAFFSGMVPYALNRADIPGGVIVIVKDGKILFAKGYGLANAEHEVPNTTRF